jgi:hypothetical protein
MAAITAMRTPVAPAMPTPAFWDTVKGGVKGGSEVGLDVAEVVE